MAGFVKGKQNFKKHMYAYIFRFTFDLFYLTLYKANITI